MSISNGDNERKLKINWNFSKSKGHNSAENYSTRPKFKLNLRIVVTHLYSELQFKMSISNGDNEQKLKINGIFVSPRGITLPKFTRLWPKFKLNLRIVVTHLYSELQFKMSISNGDNERKLKMNGIFVSPRGITLPKIIRLDRNSNSTCVFSSHIYIPKFQLKMSICKGDNERKLKINGIFVSPRGITLPKIIRPNPNSNSTCVFSWQTYVPNFIWKSPCITKIMSGHWIQKDGRTEWRKGVTLYAPAILWRGHKK